MIKPTRTEVSLILGGLVMMAGGLTLLFHTLQSVCR
jgi:hypothetical protein